MKSYIGVDFGGTKLLVGEVTSDGKIINKKTYMTGYVNQSDAVNIILSSLQDYFFNVGTGDRQPSGIGIGLIGRVDMENGIWLQIDPQRTSPIDVASKIESVFGIPCHLSNDVKSATVAEQLWGHGTRTDNFVYINVGTGIAAGTVVNGKIINGMHFNAGEVGHTQVGVKVGVKCSCGRTDCVEAIASGLGFDSCARLLSDSYPDTKLEIPQLSEGRIDVREVYRLAQEGDTLCVKLVENAAQGIANLIMNMVRMSDPDTVVLGGGIVSDSYMFDKILSYLHPKTMRFVSRGVVLTLLDPANAGLMGAAAVAVSNKRKRELV